jgi:hypothetical protein
MDKLEQYLDRVCRGIGGPRCLRQHVRQELREHLLDAVAEHKAAGLPEEQALARALEDFGGPEQVRAELEATHGHRLMTVVIDKAMQWKERTMKAKWLWTTWAHLALGGAIVLEVVFLTFALVFLVPKFERITRDVNYNPASEPALAWVPSFLRGLHWMGNNVTWCLLLVAVVWGLFEWRIRSENKSTMRLSAMGSAALGLMIAVSLTGFALVVPFMLMIPEIEAAPPEPLVRDLQARVDQSLKALEEARKKKDWEAIQKNVNQAASAMGSMNHQGASAPTLAALGEQAKIDELRAELKSASQHLWEANRASWEKDSERFEEAMRNFDRAYGKIRKNMAKP